MGRNAGVSGLTAFTGLTSLDLDAISSGDSEASTGGAPAVSPVVISDQELSVHSSETDPYSSEEGCLPDSQSEPVSPVPTDVPGQVVEYLSHYPAPAEPVQLSAVSSVLTCPGREPLTPILRPARHWGSPSHDQRSAGLPLSYDVLCRNGYRRCGSGVWHSVTPPPVPRVHRGSRVGSLAEQVTSLLDPDYELGRHCCGGSPTSA